MNLESKWQLLFNQNLNWMTQCLTTACEILPICMTCMCVCSAGNVVLCMALFICQLLNIFKTWPFYRSLRSNIDKLTIFLELLLVLQKDGPMHKKAYYCLVDGYVWACNVMKACGPFCCCVAVLSLIMSHPRTKVCQAEDSDFILEMCYMWWVQQMVVIGGRRRRFYQKMMSLDTFQANKGNCSDILSMQVLRISCF